MSNQSYDFKRVNTDGEITYQVLYVGEYKVFLRSSTGLEFMEYCGDFNRDYEKLPEKLKE